MKTFMERLNAILVTLGFIEKQKTNSLTKDDTATIVAKYNETYADFDFDTDLAEDQAQAAKAAQLDAAFAALAAMTAGETTTEGGENTEGDPAPKGSDIPKGDATSVDVAAAITALGVKIAALEKENGTLSMKLENDDPKTATMKVEGFAQAHSETHVFGIENAMFDVAKRHNKIILNPRLAKLEEPTEADEKAFKADVNTFGKTLSARFLHLAQNNMLNPEKLMASTTVDISEVGTELGNYFVVRRTDALIARLLSIPTITDFFNVRSGILDMEVINNVLVGEVSSAWQKGKYFKGDITVKPELGHVDSASIKLQFEPLTEIEQNYLGYLNTNGSDAIKWGLIEYYTMVILEKAIVEQNKRRVMGCFVAPETGVSGSYMNAATGIYFTLIRYAHQYKMQLLDDSAFKTYDSTSFLTVVNALLAEFVDIIGDDNYMDYTILLNAKHRPWWIKLVRGEYGKDTDYAGVNVNKVPDYDMSIKWMPAMGDNQFISLVKKGNVQCLENLPGEMLALKFETDFEDVLARSRWKEGVSAAFVGKKFSTAALLAANAYELQQIFMNKPATSLADDSIILDGDTNFWFESIANTTAGKKYLEVANAKAGQVYIIECGSATKPQSIDKALKFANITAAWTPTAVGDYIMVILNNAGTEYRELERMVGGVRSVNALVQPSLPEAR